MNYERIGKFIQELRKEKCLTQKDLALRLNVTDKAISKWERGLGCPDISLLEDLSNILGVSILEILKGTKIYQKDLNSDINNYILDTINYSKKEINIKYKNVLLNILSIIIIIMVGFISILNISHIVYLNKEYNYNPNNSNIKNINTNLESIKENINIIKNTNLKYTEYEKQELVKILENQYEIIKNNPLLNYKNNKLNINDLFIIDNYYYDESQIYFAYEILKKYDTRVSNYMKHYKTVLMVKGYNGISLYEEPKISYKYNINNNYFTDNYKVSARVFNVLYLSEELLILTENVIEVGDKNV